MELKRFLSVEGLLLLKNICICYRNRKNASFKDICASLTVNLKLDICESVMHKFVKQTIARIL